MAGGFVGLVARRLIVRSRGARAWDRIAWVCGAALLLACLAIALGVRGPAMLASAWVAGMLGTIALLATRLRPMLVVALVGLALGVSSLFVVLGVSSGIERVFVDSLARLNGHAMISEYGLDFDEYEVIAWELESDPEVRAASPYVFGVGAIVVVPDGEQAAGGVETDGQEREGSLEPVVVTIKGVDPEALADFSDAEQLFVAGGLDALRPAGPRTPPGIVLGVRLARRLGAQPGARVRVVVPEAISQDSDATDGRPRYGEFEVLGLLDTGFAEFDATFVLMHISAAQAIVFGKRRASGIEIELARPRLNELGAAAEKLAAKLNAPWLAQDKPPRFRAASWAERAPTLIAIRQTKALLALVLSAIIVVSSGSLLGALLLLVRREQRHIGVLAALGARPRQLFWVFELIGIGIGLLGSLLGLAWGALTLVALDLLRFELDASVYMVDHLPVAFVFGDLLVPTAIAVGVCALASGPIARQVSRTRPLALLS